MAAPVEGITQLSEALSELKIRKDSDVDSAEAETSYGSSISRCSTDSDADLLGCPYKCPATHLLLQDDHTGPTIAGTTKRLAMHGLGTRTRIIFDWDDTLFPSSWLIFHGLSLSPDASPTPVQLAELDEVAKSAEQLLAFAQSLGEVLIITAAEKGWVGHSCRKFCPRLLPTLSKMRIISARSLYESKGTIEPVLWKVRAFAAETQPYIGGPQNLISIGDSENERSALLHVSGDARRRCKSVKTPEHPTLECMLRAHGVVHENLKTVRVHDGDLDVAVYLDAESSALILY